jgi:hypothetical protein
VVFFISCGRYQRISQQTRQRNRLRSALKTTCYRWRRSGAPMFTSASHCHRASQLTEAVDVASSKLRKINAPAMIRRRIHTKLSQVEMRGIETLLILARSLYALKDLHASFSVSFVCVDLRFRPCLGARLWWILPVYK